MRRAGFPTIKTVFWNVLRYDSSGADEGVTSNFVTATTVALAPIVAPHLTIVFLNSALRETKERGLKTFVNTQLGPQKTSYFLKTSSPS